MGVSVQEATLHAASPACRQHGAGKLCVEFCLSHAPRFTLAERGRQLHDVSGRLVTSELPSQVVT
jgi:hypothetical protein